MMMKKTLTMAMMACCCLGAGAQRLAGGDLSMLPKYEQTGADIYADPQGTRIADVLTYLRDEAGYNVVRLRLFVNPTGETGVVQDLNYVKTLGARVKAAGMKLMLDFHYSDSWADPSNQYTPEAWKNLNDEQLAQQVYDYTKDCLQQLTAADATPDYIQTGNEISYGMLWGARGSSALKKCYTSSDANWQRFRTLLGKAGAACREVCPQAKIIIHTERTANWSTTRGIYERLASVDYDIIGLSYYPEWHNNLATLKSTLNNLHATFATKPVMIVETGYYNNWYPSNASYNFTSTWPASAEGQKKFLDDLVATVEPLDFVQGLLYWFPEENPHNNRVYEPWYNHGLFDPNTGRATDGLFSLKTFGSSVTAIAPPTTGAATGSSTVVATDGRQMDRATGRGVYVVDGRKIAVR